jgi:hypothetical protein
MDMRYWVKQTVDTMKALGRLLIISREQAALFDYLDRLLSPEEPVRISLDRRAGQSPVPVPVERRGALQAQTLLQSRGMIVVPVDD